MCGERSRSAHSACAGCEPRLNRLASDALIDLPWRVWVGRARSCFAHEDPVRRALWSLKYEGEIFALPFFARELERALGEIGAHDAVTCVPMQGLRVVGRGANAPALLARALARGCGMRFDPGLVVRVRSVERQVGQGRQERIENVRGAFAANAGRAKKIEGRSLLVVDDVMTTGATINECARALMKAGAGRVDAITVARAL